MKKNTIKLLSWNVNGIRSTLKKGDFLKCIEKYDPDILCLQETKAERGQAVIDLPQYEEFWNSSQEKKGYSGTAIFTKIKPQSVQFDLLSEKTLHDEQGRNAALEGRIITIEFEKFFVVTVYTPNSKDDLTRLTFRHKTWDPLFLKHLQELEQKSARGGSASGGKPVIICGDFNVAHEEIDLARPKENIGNCGFTNEEREGFQNFLKAGFIDTFRFLHKEKTEQYTWWSQRTNARARNIGWRIDYVLASQSLKKNIEEAFILQDVMGSDHCPVGIKIKI